MFSPHTFKIAYTLIACLVYSAISNANSDNDYPLEQTFAIFPHTSIHQIEQRYSPIAEDLSLILDTSVRLTTSSNIQLFTKNIRKHNFDIALVGPRQFALIAYPAGYIPLAQVAKKLTFELAVLNNSPIQDISGIKGRIGGTMQQATSDVFSIDQVIAKNKISSSDIKHIIFGSQDACALALLTRVVDICSFASPIFAVIKAKYPKKIRSIAISRSFPGAIYIAHPKTEQETIDKLKDYFISQNSLIEADIKQYAIYH